ncbi:MAG: DUF4124 domain-containing protein [Sedimenticolaceae bacterium]
MRAHARRRAGRAGFLYLLSILVLLAGVGGYFTLYPERMPDWAAKTTLGRELQTTRVYKWQDASGQWHVSDQPPPAGMEYRTQDYSHDTNALPLPPALQD